MKVLNRSPTSITTTTNDERTRDFLGKHSETLDIGRWIGTHSHTSRRQRVWSFDDDDDDDNYKYDVHNPTSEYPGQHEVAGIHYFLAPRRRRRRPRRRKSISSSDSDGAPGAGAGDGHHHVLRSSSSYGNLNPTLLRDIAMRHGARESGSSPTTKKSKSNRGADTLSQRRHSKHKHHQSSSRPDNINNQQQKQHDRTNKRYSSDEVLFMLSEMNLPGLSNITSSSDSSCSGLSSKSSSQQSRNKNCHATCTTLPLKSTTMIANEHENEQVTSSSSPFLTSWNSSFLWSIFQGIGISENDNSDTSNDGVVTVVATNSCNDNVSGSGSGSGSGSSVNVGNRKPRGVLLPRRMENS